MSKQIDALAMAVSARLVSECARDLRVRLLEDAESAETLLAWHAMDASWNALKAVREASRLDTTPVWHLGPNGGFLTRSAKP